MQSLIERWEDIWGKISESPAQKPTRVMIHNDHVDGGEKLGGEFQPDEHYFQVRVNEMYLTYKRKWTKGYDPMVLVVSEFTYDKKTEVVPFVVGPMMMEKIGKPMPAGMVYSDTRVAGLHPYRGGRLTLSIVLYRVQSVDYAQKLLQIVESTAKVLNFATALSTYVKIASVVLNGVDALCKLGHANPLIGFRKEFDPDAQDGFKPSYFALIDNSEFLPDPNKLWVRDHQLVYGENLAGAEPFQNADFVLYSITQKPERTDLTELSFYPLYERVISEAMKASTEDSWNMTKADMTSLAQTMRLSPDLTPPQADKLADKWTDEMVKRRDKAVENAKRTVGVDTGLRKIVGILDL